jgi:hypothetical protein
LIVSGEIDLFALEPQMRSTLEERRIARAG